MANHFKRPANTPTALKVNISLSNIAQRRARALVDFAIEIRNLGMAARVTALTGAIALFDGLKNQPRGNIVNRSTLLREVETRVASLIEANRDIDDLALQFDGIRIEMFSNDHNLPHFHAKYGEHLPEFDIHTLRLMKGWSPPKAKTITLALALLHREELFDDWQLAGEHKSLNAIKPLE